MPVWEFMVTLSKCLFVKENMKNYKEMVKN